MLKFLLDSTCLRLGFQWSGGSQDLVSHRVVDGASDSQWTPGFSRALGGRLGFGISAGQFRGHWVSWVLGLPEDFGLVFGLWVLIFTDGRLV